MMDVTIGEQSIKELLAAPPKITDQLNAVCRTLDLKVRNVPEISNKLGDVVKLEYGDDLHFEGRLFKRGFDSQGNIAYKAYDPLIQFKNEDDYYFKNMTAAQGFRYIAEKQEVPIGTLENTGAVLPHLYYQAKAGDRVGVDLLARTFQSSGRKFWYRYVPGSGLTLFEKKVPKEAWVFEKGVNLTSTKYEEDLEDTKTVIKLVNRETGKVVEKVSSKKGQYGRLVHFEEIDEDEVEGMDRKAKRLSDEMEQIATSMDFDGINPDQTMPMFYSGDVVFVDEGYTNLYGAYHIEDVSQHYVSDRLVEIGASIRKAPHIASIQYDDATEDPDAED